MAKKKAKKEDIQEQNQSATPEIPNSEQAKPEVEPKPGKSIFDEVTNYGWSDQEVEVPMSKETYDALSNEMASVLVERQQLLIDLSVAKDRVKKIEEKEQVFIQKFASGKVKQTVPCLWVFNWKKNIKKCEARLSDGTIHEVFSGEITESDRQMKIADAAKQSREKENEEPVTLADIGGHLEPEEPEVSPPTDEEFAEPELVTEEA